MKLSTLDRIALLGVLPREGNFLTLATVQDINAKVQLTADERDKLDIKQTDKGISWTGEAQLETEFTDAETKVITEALAALDSKNKLIADQMGIYRLFMLNG